MKILKKPVRSLTSLERKQVAQLVISQNSYMEAVLHNRPEQTCCWLALSAEDCISGWSLLRWFTPDVRSLTMGYINVFVAPQSRQQGIGKRLILEAIGEATHRGMVPRVYGPSLQQLRFYQACAIPDRYVSTQAFPTEYWENYHYVKKAIRRREVSV